MKKILLFNAAPRSGKDTMASWFESRGWYHGKFSKVLKERTHAIYGMPHLPHDYFEDCKDEVLDEFLGISPRQAYINLSEMLMKPVHGDDIWVRMFAKELEKVREDYIVVSDLGFQVEWETLIKILGYDKVAVGMIYRDGCNFDNDSRDYIAPRGPWQYIDKPDDGFPKYIMSNCFDIENGGTIEDLHKKCEEIEFIVKNEMEIVPEGNGVPIGAVPNQKVVGK